jgi:signal transduction histidine kinase
VGAFCGHRGTRCRVRRLGGHRDRRRIERDLRDGAQQRLVTVGLKVRSAMDHLPAGLDGPNAELSDVACGLTAVLEDRRRTSFFPLSTVYIF